MGRRWLPESSGSSSELAKDPFVVMPGRGVCGGDSGSALPTPPDLCLLYREMVMTKLTSCCRRSSNVSYKYSKVA